MSQPAARISDNHVCPMATPGTPPVPHVGGPIIMGAPTVLTGSMPQARVSDSCICVGPPDTIVKGSMTVLVNNLPAARIGDMTVHGGTIATGCPTVLIGDAGGGGGGAGAGMMTSGAALTKAVEQADALKKAAESGTPFCERCPAAAAARNASG